MCLTIQSDWFDIQLSFDWFGNSIYFLSDPEEHDDTEDILEFVGDFNWSTSLRTPKLKQN